MLKLNFLFIFLFASLSNICQASLLPDYDKNCANMKCGHAEVDPFDNVEHFEYFNKPVPKIIHQIWFGNQNKRPQKKTIKWQEYAQLFGYDYRLTTEKEMAFIKETLTPDEFAMLDHLLYRQDYWGASDILRVGLLREYGGVYIDCDFLPPKHHEKYVDLNDFLNMKGITLVTEHHGREVGESAIFVMNGIIISCPHHPIMEGMSKHILNNIKHWHNRKHTISAMYCTGPFLLNKVIWGTFNVVPVGYIEALGMD